ncbi:germination protein [Paraliobacillus quinghaiensis]|uniref:Germination protein n=1 Tax=Paraliobacillus quinghaiensis TaxID=470815 RepID=A0A917WRW7_9BACI|nr:endospore germination permease [Paraliobacillus quinghaiensis]GGM24365.1 germination protein [Paraliobacillus quinghaiensis]
MLENGRISIKQLASLVIFFTIGSSILVAPSGLAQAAEKDAWISSILGVLIGLLFVTLYNSLQKEFPDKTLVQCSEIILGKWLGKLVALSFLSYFFILASVLLREIGDFVTTQIMLDTPIEAILILFAVVVMIGVRLGLETYSRATEIFFPWVFILFTLLITFSAPEIDITKVQPLLGNGFKPVLQATFPFLGLPFLELVVFLMILPYVKNQNKAGKAFLIGTLIGGLTLIIITVACLLVLGPDLTARNNYPSYVLGKKMRITEILERLEVIVAIIWFLTIFFKLVICFYATTLGLAQMLRLKDYRSLVYPLGMILVILAIIISPNVTYFHYIMEKTWTPYSLTYGLFLPLLLLVVSRVRKSTGSLNKRK